MGLDPSVPLPRALRALAHEAASPEKSLTLWPSWNRRRQVGASSFSPTVPPTCHKQRLRAVPADSHGHSEKTVRRAPVPDLEWGSRPKLHGMQVVKVDSGHGCGEDKRADIVDERSKGWRYISVH
jgi:hypothetical protein